MKKIKIILGYSWAILAFVMILLLFPALDPLSEQVARLPFMKISPLYQGGETDKGISKDNYVITVNKPVFESLAGESEKGFVQVKWEGNVPEIFSDTIDYNHDRKADFIVSFSGKTQTPLVKTIAKNVMGMNVWAKTEKGWIVRVGLRNEKR